MAKNKNNRKDGKVTANDLFDRLKPKNSGKNQPSEDEDLLTPEEFADEKQSGNGFSIDVSSDEESDSELDINELLKKYMPEYGEEEEAEADTGASAGVLSKLKKKAAQLESDPDGDSGDDRLISALDSAFGPAEDESAPAAAGDFDFMDDGDAPLPEDDDDFGDYDDEDPDYDGEAFVSIRKLKEKKKEQAPEPEKKKKKFSLFGRKKKEEPEFLFDDEEPAPLSEEAEPREVPVFAEADSEEAAFAAPVMPEEEVSFRTADLALGDIAELEGILQGPQPGNKITPGSRKADRDEDELLAKLAALEEAEALAGAEEPAAEVSGETASADALEFGFDEFAGESAAEEPVREEPAAEETAAGSAESDDFEAEAEDAEPVQDEEIDPTDLNLRVAFGLDGDDRKSSQTAAKQFGDQLEARQNRREKRAKLDRPEFVDKTQIPKIRKEYKNRMVSLWIRLALCAVFAIGLMWFENISFFTGLFTGVPQQFAGVFDPAVYPVVYIMTSLQLMLLACVCASEQIIDGFKFIVRGTPKAESLTALLMTAGVLYSAILARIIETPNEPVMFNFAVALSALMTLIYAVYNTKREIMNFDVVSAKKTKHIVRRLPDEESRCEAQAFMEQTDACDVMKIEKTDFIDGFFGRLCRPDSSVSVFMTCIMSVTAAVAVLAGFFMSLRGGETEAVLRTAYMVLLTAAPMSVFVTFSYPFYRATAAAKEYESAIIGEASLSEYSNASIISFDDKNVFPSYSVKIQNIKIFNNARVDRVLYYASSVFAYAGGPLQDVFEVTTLEMGHSEDVKIFDTEAGFLATQVNGVNIIFGSYKALTAKGFDIPPEHAADDVDFSSELSIMYMFREDKLVAKMYVKYVMDGDIDLILKQFQGTGLYVCVRTFDPNIDERMIAKKLNMKKIPLKVVRYASTEEVTMYEEKVDSGLVTSSSPKSLLQVIAYCDKVLHTRKTNIALGILSLIIGLAVLALLIMSDTLGIVNSLFIALYHLIWTIPMVISAKMFIR